MKKMNKKGFTLAELLIVVAIIAVLVAIAIPVFNAQLEKSRQATDTANLRSAYGEAVATYLADPDNKSALTTIDLGAAEFNVEFIGTNSDEVKVTFSKGNKSDKFASAYYTKDGLGGVTS